MEPSDRRDEQGRRVNVGFIPYRRTSAGLEFFLQFRDANASIHVQMFSMFGGGVAEGETPEQGLMREVEEELQYAPHAPKLFCVYATQRALFHTYFEEVVGDFEQMVSVQEGEYGAFLAEQDIQMRPDVSPITKLIIEEFVCFVRAGGTIDV